MINKFIPSFFLASALIISHANAMEETPEVQKYVAKMSPKLSEIYNASDRKTCSKRLSNDESDEILAEVNGIICVLEQSIPNYDDVVVTLSSLKNMQKSGSLNVKETTVLLETEETRNALLKQQKEKPGNEFLFAKVDLEYQKSAQKYIENTLSEEQAKLIEIKNKIETLETPTFLLLKDLHSISLFL